MLIYLDMCCFNRPFDAQDQMRIRLETDATLYIQSQLSAGVFTLCWSYMHDFENYQNPYEDRRKAIAKWKSKAAIYCPASENIRAIGNELSKIGIAPKDALHVACAQVSRCKYFITTDLKLLKKQRIDLNIVNPVDFIMKTESER